jgi:hypothetical protein
MGMMTGPRASGIMDEQTGVILWQPIRSSAN